MDTMDMQDTTRTNRKHKDRLFRFIFKHKKELLSLYNAVNNSDYTDPEELIIYTMEDYVYMGMKNDLAFLIDWNLNVFEHQSTYNPNMPLRGLFYVSAALKKFVELHDLDLFSSKLLTIPVPRYYVFYNGERKMEDEVKLHLTDSMEGEGVREKSCVQFVAHMININEGHNPEIMKRCPTLYEYARFVSEIRKNVKAGMLREEAIDKAVVYCIENEILADILRGNRAEVTEMLMTEYNEARHISNEKEISYEQGFEEGIRLEKENTERERQKAECERQKAESERQKAECERQKAENERIRAEVFKHKLQGKSNEEISECVKLSLDQIRNILDTV